MNLSRRKKNFLNPIRLQQLLAVMVLICFVSCSQRDTKKEVRPNVVFILADDLGYGDIGAYNADSKIPTPNLDKLASEGIMLENAYCPISVCSPTRYALMTGTYPWRSWNKHGVMRNYEPSMMDADMITLAEMFQQSGYSTGGFGKWHLGATFPTLDGERPTGYGKFYAKNNGSNLDFSKPISDGPTDHGFENWYGFSCASECWVFENDMVDAYLEHDYYTVDQAPGAENLTSLPMNSFLNVITDRALKFVGENQDKGEEPFFLYYAPYVPHVPLAVSDSFLGKTEAGPYGDYVHELDHYIGKLLKGLDEMGLKENTIVLFASDNGSVFRMTYKGMEASDDNNRVPGHYIDTVGTSFLQEKDLTDKHIPNGELRGWKRTAWEGGVRTPFIASWPGHFPEGTTNNTIFALNDVLPSLGSLLDFKFPEDFKIDGVDQFSVWENKKGPREALAIQSGNNVFGYRKNEWKLIVMPMGPKDNRTGHFYELYNLEEDPQERTNLADKHPDLVQELHEELKQYL
ncbi:sulfatase [Euzebyella marina]|uniref:Sulfatase n=1 Tax=Euzebyella marina TaxID=1761453 RepID=A0A3G2LA11_9FLAO|nr:arylsulfatase [Euzebyella marina]AYN69087.1 sulfatase [Euzebyella marina]